MDYQDSRKSKDLGEAAVRTLTVQSHGTGVSPRDPLGALPVSRPPLPLHLHCLRDLTLSPEPGLISWIETAEKANVSLSPPKVAVIQPRR